MHRFIQSILLLLPLTSALQSAPVYPTPRSSLPLGGFVTITRSTTIRPCGDGASPTAIGLLRDHLDSLVAGPEGPSLVIGTRGEQDIDSLLGDVPKISGAYRILIEPRRVVLAGHDSRGCYYAALTFMQLLDAGTGRVATADIRDWPEVPDRGVVEGFYGTPWSHEIRLRLIRFLGEHKMDTYIYGPKDDPYHSSPKWREPYPAAESAKIRELATASAKNHVDFYWAIHPGKDIHWNDEDYSKVLGKFESMYALGIRAFAVFFDDISGEGTKAERQAELLNRLHNDFVLKKGDVLPLVMCPTQYNKAWSGGDYLDTLGTALDPSIQVMWTGNKVVADLDLPSMEWINAKLRRKAYIWWNFPVSDYVRDHLLMGPVYGNSLDIGPLYGGFVSNPMERAEASRVALFGVADYTWNPAKFDSEASFRAAISEILPGAPEAFSTFCRHNSDLGPSNHGYRRQESVDFAPLAEMFMTTVRQGGTPDFTRVRAEFEAIATSPAKIRQGSKNPFLIAEISPWLDAFAQLGNAGRAALDAMTPLAANQQAAAWKSLAEAHAALAEMAKIDRTANQNPYQPGIETASLVVTPMVKELVTILDSRLLATLSGGTLGRAVPITSARERESLPRMIDGDDKTFACIKEVQKAGDWFGLDLGALRKIERVRVLLGRNDDDHDRIHDGVLEGSTGDSWETIARVDSPQVDVTLATPRQFRALRVRIQKPGSRAKADLWTAIRSFEVNPEQAASIRTDITAFAKVPVRSDGNTVSLTPVLEIYRVPAGAYLGLLFSGPVTAETFTVDLDTANPAGAFSLETTGGETGWKKLAATAVGTALTAELKKPVSAVRVVNTGEAAREVKLKRFSVTLAARTASTATDGDLATTADLASGATVALPEGEGNFAVILAAPAPGPAVTVSAVLSNGQRRPLGKLASGFGKFPLPATAAALIFDSKSPTTVHEIFRSSR